MCYVCQNTRASAAALFSSGAHRADNAAPHFFVDFTPADRRCNWGGRGRGGWWRGGREDASLPMQHGQGGPAEPRAAPQPTREFGSQLCSFFWFWFRFRPVLRFLMVFISVKASENTEQNYRTCDAAGQKPPGAAHSSSPLHL